MTNFAWEVTPEDIQTVAGQHNLHLTLEQADGLSLDCDEIVTNVLRYIDFDDQCNSMYDDIENLLLSKGVITGEKVYHAPA
jgi:hypothetical protein